MTSMEQELDIIEAYLKGTLDSTEQKAFETRLKEADFKQTVDDIQVLINGIYESEHRSMRHKMSKWDQEMDQQDSTPVVKMPMIKWAIAAAIAIFIAASVYIINNTLNPGLNNQEIVATVYEPYPSVAFSSQRGIEQEMDIYMQAFRAYDNQEYKNFLNLSKKLVDPEYHVYIVFYQAQSHQSLGEDGKAIALYQEVIEENDLFLNQALWYQALGYLNSDQTELAVSNLKELEKGTSSYATKAVKLLEELK